jgi:hypothetical protein
MSIIVNYIHFISAVTILSNTHVGFEVLTLLILDTKVWRHVDC